MPDKRSPSPSTPSDAGRPRSWLWASLMAGVASLVAACKSPPVPPQRGPDATLQDQAAGAPASSGAATPRAYRQDAAKHLYARNAQRIYAGPLPPMLYAIGVLEVDIDRNGRVQRLSWMRAPRHAPEVIAEIERTVRSAAPYPVPARMGKVTYTDTWLWDKSGQFQLDTLTEGQR
ncbi:hypothetical protein [Pantoea sp. 18069]|uniref:hypothetical protein n=1 Tax=Pantoea sp. 18069 TaxID=2681415 RepID=UPI001357B5F0|nr:hypothetical protein [Pantoea sp. 18069]